MEPRQQIKCKAKRKTKFRTPIFCRRPTTLRNPGLALLIIQGMAPNAIDLKAAVVGYVVVTAVGSAPFMKWRQADASQDQITGDA